MGRGVWRSAGAFMIGYISLPLFMVTAEGTEAPFWDRNNQKNDSSKQDVNLYGTSIIIKSRIRWRCIFNTIPDKVEDLMSTLSTIGVPDLIGNWKPSPMVKENANIPCQHVKKLDQHLTE
jgi:hypothetical protein